MGPGGMMDYLFCVVYGAGTSGSWASGVYGVRVPIYKRTSKAPQNKYINNPSGSVELGFVLSFMTCSSNNQSELPKSFLSLSSRSAPQQYL